MFSPTTYLQSPYRGVVWFLLRKTPERKFWAAYFREMLDQVDSELLATRYKATVDLFSNHTCTAEDLAVHTFAGTGHGSYVMDPIGYSRVVREFLDGLIGRR